MKKKLETKLNTKYGIIFTFLLALVIFYPYLTSLLEGDLENSAAVAVLPVSIKSFSFNGVTGNSGVINVVKGDPIVLKWQSQNAKLCVGWTGSGFSSKISPTWNRSIKIGTNNTVGYRAVADVVGSWSYGLTCYPTKGAGVSIYFYVNVRADATKVLNNVSLSYGNFSTQTRVLPITIVPNQSTLPYRYVVLITDENQKTIGSVTGTSSAGGNSVYNWSVPASFGLTSKFRVDVEVYSPTGALTKLAGITSPLRTLQ